MSAQEFDQQVESDASAISSNYAGVVQLSIRQAFGAMELTISQSSDGSWNTSDVLMFLKGMFHLRVTSKLRLTSGQKYLVMECVRVLAHIWRNVLMCTDLLRMSTLLT